MRWHKDKNLGLGLSILISLVLVLHFPGGTYAASLSNRSIRVDSPKPSVVTNHTISFTVPTGGPIGSIGFEYCSNSPLFDVPCVPPAGLDVSLAFINSQSGVTGFSVHGLTTQNSLLISRTPAAVGGFQDATFAFGNVTNPSYVNAPTYVRISTFASDNGSGPSTDEGAVVFALSRDLTVEAFVPPYLTFCAAITVSADCGSATGNFINLGELSAASARSSTSQFAGATNDPGGYSTFLAGSTMTSGINIIPPITSPDTSRPGAGQFGLNLVTNSNPQVGKNRTGAGTAVPMSDYGNPNRFKFGNEIIAASTNSTNFNVFTVSYLVNISSSQKPGIYTTTMTYIATAAF